MQAKAVTKIIQYVAQLGDNIPSGVLNNINNIVTLGTVASAASSVFQGQAMGNPLDLVGGVLDVGEEQYYENGGTQSGTTYGALGNLAQSAALGVYVAYANKFGFKNPQLMKQINRGIFAWQAGTLADEALRGDGDPFKDKLDLGGNVLTLLSLAPLCMKGGKAISKIPNLVKPLVQAPIQALAMAA